ncbi:MAG: hypothetical protein J0L82_08670 [Deltaproteobacteria bacterium]|jgi:signal transduction histidine kinase|nr:hypothetical protein [Deltaproteobacteria bacterium]
MHLYPQHLSTKQKLDLELARRSPNSAIVFGLVAAALFLFDFGPKDQAVWTKSCALILVVISLIRYLTAKILMAQLSPHQRTTFVLYLSIMLNAVFSVMITAPTYYAEKFSSISVYILTCLTTGFAFGASASLAPLPIMGISVQSILLLAPVGTALALSSGSNDNDYYTVAVLHIILWLHSGMVLKQNHRDLKLAMNFEVSMLKSNAELKHSQEQLANETAKLIHVSRLTSLGEMAGGIAHEVNNPLAIMQGHLINIKRQTLEIQDREASKKISDKADRILYAIQRIAKIVHGLRVFSQQSDHLPFESVNFRSIIDQTSEFVAEKMRSRGVEFRLNVATDSWLLCRPVQISQVLINFINNSLDAIEDQNVERVDGKNSPKTDNWISLDAAIVADKLVIHFRDSGLGISKQGQEKLFQPFYTTKELGKGTGLGLSISRGIIADHGGTIRYRPNDKHTCFIIELPLNASSQFSNEIVS